MQRNRFIENKIGFFYSFSTRILRNNIKQSEISFILHMRRIVFLYQELFSKHNGKSITLLAVNAWRNAFVLVFVVEMLNSVVCVAFQFFKSAFYNSTKIPACAISTANSKNAILIAKKRFLGLKKKKSKPPLIDHRFLLYRTFCCTLQISPIS